MGRTAKIGVASWAYTAYDSRDWNEVFKALGEKGIEGIELSGSLDHHHPSSFPTKHDRKSLVNNLKNLGLSICGYYARMSDIPPISEDDSRRAKYIELFRENIQFCVDCAIPAVRVDTVERPPLGEPNKSETKMRLLETWEKCAEYASKYGIDIVWEFEPGFIFNKPHDIAEIIHAVDHPNFGVLFDFSHAYMCAVSGAKQEKPYDRLEGGVVESVKLLKGKILRVHLSDSDGTLHNNISSTHVPLGEGYLDFDAVVKTVLDSGYNRIWWSIDPCFQQNPLRSISQDIKFVQNLLRKFGIRQRSS